MLLEHMRIAPMGHPGIQPQPKYNLPPGPDYWPPAEAPPNAAAWNESVTNFREDLSSWRT